MVRVGNKRYLWFVAALVAVSVACESQAPGARSEPEEPQKKQTQKSQTNGEGDEVAQPDRQKTLEALPDVVERAVPSVVGIATKRTVRMAPQSPFGSPFFHPFMPQRPMERMQEGMGSGVIVSTDGVILTNNHVVDGADEITVSLWDKRELRAEVVGTDPKSDIAVVRLLEPPSDLRAMPFGNSDDIRLGESVVAIGNPFGLSSTVTMGIVSAKGRANVGIVDYEDFIQTDAAINPGNSGGALINLRGELVGINTAIVSRSGGYQGIGFAIPSNMARSIQESLIQNGKVSRGWLGVAIQDLDPQLAEALDVDPGEDGVLVSDVQRGSPAEEAGLQRGDIIQRIADRPVRTSTELRTFVALQAPGESVKVDLLRGGKPQTLEVKLGELGGGPNAGVQEVGGLEGLTLSRLDPEFRARHRVAEGIDGVAVTDVAPGSPAAQLGLRPGDVIVEVNRRKLRNPLDFDAAFAASTGKALFLVHREGATIFLAMSKR